MLIQQIDFLSNAHLHRQKHGGGLGQLIAKAVGVKSTYKPYVLDCTAGLGEDAFVLACLGCKVHMLERSEKIADLLEDALLRLKQHEDYKEIQLTLQKMDAIDYLRSLSHKNFPDVIYLDPMFSAKKKTALNKKEMRFLRDTVGDDMDAGELLKAALSKAKKRIVVKRHRLAPTLIESKVDFIYEGKSTRFDVYLPKV